jgi:hypothetical protein
MKTTDSETYIDFEDEEIGVAISITEGMKSGLLSENEKEAFLNSLNKQSDTFEK